MEASSQHNPISWKFERKRNLLEDRCCVCGQDEESSIHVMFECKLSQVVWDNVYPKMNEILVRQASIGNL